MSKLAPYKDNFLATMDDERFEKEEGLGPLSSVSDEHPHPSTSQAEPQQPTQNTYWLAQYFTRGRYDQGMTVMAVNINVDKQ